MSDKTPQEDSESMTQIQNSSYPASPIRVCSVAVPLSEAKEVIGKGINRRDPIFLPDVSDATNGNSQGLRVEKHHLLLPQHYAASLDYCLIPRGFINDRIEKLASDIRQDYGDQPIHLLCILKGSRGFFSELIKILDRIHRYSSIGLRTKVEYELKQELSNHNLQAMGGGGNNDSGLDTPPNAQYQQAGTTAAQLAAGSLHYRTTPYFEHYIRLKSYENTESTGSLKVISDDLSVLKDQHVLIVEDIIDTGNTLEKFCAHLSHYSPKSVRIASLLEKRTVKNITGIRGDYVGFSVPDYFIVGYCLDYNEFFRDLEHICVMNKSGILKYKV